MPIPLRDTPFKEQATSKVEGKALLQPGFAPTKRQSERTKRSLLHCAAPEQPLFCVAP